MRSRGERGATLVELLVVTVTIGVIAVVLTEAVILSLRQTGATDRRVVSSLDRQRVASWFVPDVASAAAIAESPASPACAAQGIGVLYLVDSNGVALHYAVQDSPGGPSLSRQRCGAGTQLLAESLAPLSEGPVSVDCSAAPACTLTVTDIDGDSYSITATTRIR